MLLWLACRHIRTSYEVCKRSCYWAKMVQMIHCLDVLGRYFGFIDLQDSVLWTWPTNREHDWRCQQANDVLEWANVNMELGTCERDNNRHASWWLTTSWSEMDQQFLLMLNLENQVLFIKLHLWRRACVYSKYPFSFTK